MIPDLLAWVTEDLSAEDTAIYLRARDAARDAPTALLVQSDPVSRGLVAAGLDADEILLELALVTFEIATLPAATAPSASLAA